MEVPGSEDRARRVARRTLEECNISGLPVEPTRIAKSKSQLLVQTGVDLGKEAYGVFSYHRGHFIILISAHCHTRSHRRFSLAHELGHFCLPNHLEAIFSTGPSHLTTNLSAADGDLEKEANFFASELLMPKWGVERILNGCAKGLDSILRISKTCESSLVSSAIRYANHVRRPTVILESDGSSISFATLSDKLWGASRFRGNRPRPGDAIPEGSPTALLGGQSGEVLARRTRAEVVSATKWFPDAPSDLLFNEEARGLGSYGKILTVLTAVD